ncbi:hypothetical protein [Nonomuraea sediminis]|uniref:hypothetical protein n=1 Tax=Nonomuraea sediminis TaxID=2835864 RepID=UPI001BDBF467|nr:hypothetical protein [Nonomuraea sediminis]
MPLVNIARLLTREGDGQAAYALLQQLYRAAQLRGAAVIHDHDVDLAPLIQTDDDHRKLCTELWVTLLVDGARALARQGHWSQAADAMAAHRGIGNRLLDGRQIKIMALIEQGLTGEATAMIDSTIPGEPWEHTVAAILRIACRPTTSPPSRQELDHAVRETLALVTQPDPLTAVFRARLGLTALDLAADQPPKDVSSLRAAIIDVASGDAYAARDALDHHELRSQMTHEQQKQIAAMLAAAGLGAASLPTVHLDTLTAAVQHAEGRLRTLLATTDRTQLSRSGLLSDPRSGLPCGLPDSTRPI